MGIVIETPPDNVAFSIALGVLLLSVVLHPIVRACFHRIRADRAWKSIEKREQVEVTKYNVFSEALGDRGRWDTARVVTFMLAAFHVSTWGLELSLDLALRTDGPVDLLNRPPPVVSRVNVTQPGGNVTDWIVQMSEEPIPEGGTLGNFHGDLIDGNATTSYRIGDSIVDGNTLFASWSPEAARISSGLFYDIDDGTAIIRGSTCSLSSRSAAVYVESRTGQRQRWGDVTECESGPLLLNTSSTDRSSPPTIILNSNEGVLHMIVEEESSYPSFLYSVWEPADDTPDTVELRHVFFVSSTTRLAEAIVSGIANGIVTGGGCVDLLAQFSVTNATYELNGANRASPFGEHPRSSSVERLDQVEPIVAGVLVSELGTVCGVLLLVVTGVAFAGCLFSHSRKALDVYDRDELIRAVSLPGGEGSDGKPVALKIYVRQETDKAFSIVISDDGVYRGCAGLRNRLLGNNGESSVPSSRSISRSGSLPMGSRGITFDGVRPTIEDASSALGETHHSHNGTPGGLHNGSTGRLHIGTPARPHGTPARLHGTPARRTQRAGDRTPSRRTPRVVELIASPLPTPSRNAQPTRDIALVALNEFSAVTPDSVEGEGVVPVRVDAKNAWVHANAKRTPTRVDMEAPDTE